ncbi:MAG: toxic anion resistance protein, partial [Chloroflexi bacterium]|nr:toxic anion resistance protein [Chloroflexota bacterium]
TMEEVHTQFFVSIEMTRQNNTRLGHAVESTLTVATNVVTVGLAIQVALIRQRDVLRATQRTREFLGEMIVANAETINRHIQEIGDVYKEPVIALEKITQAHNALMEAMDMADRLKQEGLVSARENIVRLSQLAGELEQRFEGMRELPEGKSLEA